MAAEPTNQELLDQIDQYEEFLSDLADGSIPLGEIQDAAADLLSGEEPEEQEQTDGGTSEDD